MMQLRVLRVLQGVVEQAMHNQAALSTPEEDVNDLMQQVAGAAPIATPLLADTMSLCTPLTLCTSICLEEHLKAAAVSAPQLPFSTLQNAGADVLQLST